MSSDSTLYIVGGSIAIIILIIILGAYGKYRKNQSVSRTTQCCRQQPPIQTIAAATCGRISMQGELYAVPKDILPVNFDCYRSGIKDMGTYILVSDLSLIDSFQNSSGYRQEEYQKQAPYNPNFS